MIVVAAERSDQERLQALGARIAAAPSGKFHFGRALSGVIEGEGGGPLAYFGGASAPLATKEVLALWRGQAGELPAGGALVNNLHSTDWAILTDPTTIPNLAERFPSDNPLGWVLATEAGVSVRSLPPQAVSRTDLDTPGDAALLRGHPHLGRSLRSRLADLPEALSRRAERVTDVLHTPASSLALIGRVSETAWSETVRQTQLWVRVYAEERGLRASGRLERGEARSLIADLLDSDGPAKFVERLGTMVEACLWDTRVWMAGAGGWPSTADRMAADLGWADQVDHPALQRLTEAVGVAGSPAILTGGHGVVSGSLLACLETLQVGKNGGPAAYQPSR